jgi:electron transport complex protein RnfG
MLARHMVRSALLLGLFALIGTGLVAAIYLGTKTPIEEAERAYMLRSLHSVIKPELHDNDIFSDYIEVQSPKYLGTDKPVPVFRARRNGQPVAVAILPTAPDGYVGAIRLLVGIDTEGTILGVRVLSHHETPGLGDAIEERRSPWIFSFNGHSLDNPGKDGWRVRRDGGQFDQFTGATITPRAVVKAVHNALLFFQSNKERLFSEKSLAQPEKSPS